MIAFGQAVSLLGTGMTSFAITIWAWKETGLASAIAVIVFFSFLASVLTGPIAGIIVDRYPRKTVLVLSDAGSALATLTLLILHKWGELQLWQVCITVSLAGACQAVQAPAITASITLMVERAQYVRANAFLDLGGSMASSVAPLAGALILPFAGLETVFLVDLASFAVAIGTILLVTVPSPSSTETDRPKLEWRQILDGFQYIVRDRPLFDLQLVLLFANLVRTFALVLLPVLILARTANDETSLGIVQSVMGVGAIIGSLLMVAWGGPRNRLHGVLLGILGASVLGSIGIGLSRVVWMWAAAAFAVTFFSPMVNGCNRAIWQSRVPARRQGRVFAARLVIAQVSIPIAFLSSGPLADYLFGPEMKLPDSLTLLLDPVVAPGSGNGVSLIFLIAGTLGALICVLGYLRLAGTELENQTADLQSPASAPGPHPEPATQERSRGKPHLSDGPVLRLLRRFRRRVS